MAHFVRISTEPNQLTIYINLPLVLVTPPPPFLLGVQPPSTPQALCSEFLFSCLHSFEKNADMPCTIRPEKECNNYIPYIHNYIPYIHNYIHHTHMFLLYTQRTGHSLCIKILITNVKLTQQSDIHCIVYTNKHKLL